MALLILISSQLDKKSMKDGTIMTINPATYCTDTIDSKEMELDLVVLVK